MDVVSNHLQNNNNNSMYLESESRCEIGLPDKSTWQLEEYDLINQEITEFCF